MYGEQQTTLFKHLSIKGILKRIDHVIHKTKLHVQFIYITAKVDIIRTSVYFLKIFLRQMKKFYRCNRILGMNPDRHRFFDFSR